MCSSIFCSPSCPTFGVHFSTTAVDQRSHQHTQTRMGTGCTPPAPCTLEHLRLCPHPNRRKCQSHRENEPPEYVTVHSCTHQAKCGTIPGKIHAPVIGLAHQLVPQMSEASYDEAQQTSKASQGLGPGNPRTVFELEPAARRKAGHCTIAHIMSQLLLLSDWLDGGS